MITRRKKKDWVRLGRKKTGDKQQTPSHLFTYPRTVPKDDACAQELKKRTLTNLYNQRPTWLEPAHQKLDAAVFAAYGWQPDLT